MMVLVTGGSGCGKSTWAEGLIAAHAAGRRYYIATMSARDGESLQRVARHRRQREGLGFETVEQPQNLSAFAPAPGAVVLLEDIPNLLANEMFDGGDPERILPAVRQLSLSAELLVAVTNDVFSDGVSYAEGTRAYMKKLAEINREIACLADAVVEVVYAIPLVIKGELPCVF